MTKRKLDKIIFDFALYEHNIKKIIEDIIEKRLSTDMPDHRKIATFKVVKEMALSLMKEIEIESVQKTLNLMINRCEEQLNQMHNKLLSNDRKGTVGYLARKGYLGPIKDQDKYIVWDPVFKAHRHEVRLKEKHNGKELLERLRREGFETKIIEKIIWDDLFTNDILQAVRYLNKNEVSRLVNKLLSIKFMDNTVEWTVILAGKILTELPEKERDIKLLRAVSMRLLKDESHSSAKVLLELSGVKKYYCNDDIYNMDDESEDYKVSFVDQLVNDNFWNTILPGEGEMDVIEKACELNPYQIISDKIGIMQFSRVDMEHYIEYLELNPKELKSKLTELTETYTDWRKSNSDRKRAIEVIVNICNNHRGATNIKINMDNKTKQLITWIEDFIKYPPVPQPDVHKNVNLNIIDETSSYLELLFRVDRFGKYYNEIMKKE